MRSVNPQGRVIEIRPFQYATTPSWGPLEFPSGANGVARLTLGWGDPESWGSWSVAKRAVLRVRAESKDGLPLHAELKFLPFIGPGHPQIDVACRVRGKEIARWNCPSAGWQIRTFTISSDLIGSDGIVDLEFLICHPRSPAELGIGADTRQLGIGVEWLDIGSRDLDDAREKVEEWRTEYNEVKPHSPSQDASVLDPSASALRPGDRLA